MSTRVHKPVDPQAKIYFPQTEKEFDQLVKKVVRQYKLPNVEHAAVVIANRIMHLPPDQAMTTMEYLGHCVKKNIAYQVASAKGSQISHKMQVNQLVANLKSNINDQQSRDALKKASDEGSVYASQMFNELFEEKPVEILGQT